MKDKKSKKLQGPEDIENQSLFAASTTDCTGLIPSQPANEDELESYSQLYNFCPEQDKNS